MTNPQIFVNKKINISDIISQEEKNSDFVEGIINLPDMQKRKKYNVMICNLKNDNTYLLKPIKKYKCLVFEELFGFEYECADFDEEKIIKIKF